MDEILELAAAVAKPFEGLELKAYHDPVGYPTQGYGRLLSRTPWEPLDKWPDIDEHTAEEWLKEDMTKAVRAALRLCPGAETPEQYAAIADFAFNCGAGNLQASTLRRKVNRGDFFGAEKEFSKWVFARGVKLPGLVRRRRAEADMFRGA
jgi:lysozyme